MSADNWGVCPKCGNEEQEGLETSTLREDYEIGIWAGQFEITYHGHCKECDYDKKFKHKESA